MIFLMKWLKNLDETIEFFMIEIFMYEIMIFMIFIIGVIL